jgi:hypothetical protein
MTIRCVFAGGWRRGRTGRCGGLIGLCVVRLLFDLFAKLCRRHSITAAVARYRVGGYRLQGGQKRCHLGAMGGVLAAMT